MSAAHVVDRLSAYLDGEVPPPERAAVEAHLRECAECARQLEELAAVDEMARGLPAEAPTAYFDAFPARLRERLGPRPRAGPWRPPVWTLAAAAALVLAVVTPLTLKNGTHPEPAPVAEAPAHQAVPPATEVARPGAPAAGNAGLADRDRERDDKLRGLGYIGGEASKQAREKEESSRAPQKARPRQPAESLKADRLAKEQPSGSLAEEVQAYAESPAVTTGAASTSTTAPAAPPASAAQSPAPAEPRPKPSFAQAPPSTADEAAPAGAAGRAEGFENRESASSKRAQVEKKVETKRKDENRYQALLERQAGTADEARALRDSWRTFAREHADDPRADEARVRAVEAGATAWRLGGDPADLAAVREDAAAYLTQVQGAQAERVRAVLRHLER